MFAIDVMVYLIVRSSPPRRRSSAGTRGAYFVIGCANLSMRPFAGAAAMHRMRRESCCCLQRSVSCFLDLATLVFAGCGFWGDRSFFWRWGDVLCSGRVQVHKFPVVPGSHANKVWITEAGHAEDRRGYVNVTESLWHQTAHGVWGFFEDVMCVCDYWCERRRREGLG